VAQRALLDTRRPPYPPLALSALLTPSSRPLASLFARSNVASRLIVDGAVGCDAPRVLGQRLPAAVVAVQQAAEEDTPVRRQRRGGGVARRDVVADGLH